MIPLRFISIYFYIFYYRTLKQQIGNIDVAVGIHAVCFVFKCNKINLFSILHVELHFY